MSRVVIENVSVGYEERTIVKDCSIQIPDHKITTIIGPNGCGKSTLLKATTRIIQYQEGRIILDGNEITKEKTKELAKKMAILPQAPEGMKGLLVGELVAYGRFPYQTGFGRLSKKDLEVIDWALEVTGVMAYKNKVVDSLSGGQRQRVWIAMALAQETDIIFLDEPTTYLDIAHQLEVLTLLQKLNEEEGRTIVMVLHDINQAAQFSDHIIAMKDGQVVKTGTSNEVISKEILQEVFNIEAEIVTAPSTGRPTCLSFNLIN